MFKTLATSCAYGCGGGYWTAVRARFRRRHGSYGDVDVSVVLITHHQVHQYRAGAACVEAKDDNFGVVIWPLTHCQVQVTVDFLSCKQSHMMDLLQSTVQVELPPVEMVGIEREIIIFSTVAGVGQNVAATFGEAKKDMSCSQKLLADDVLQWNTHSGR